VSDRPGAAARDGRARDPPQGTPLPLEEGYGIGLEPEELGKGEGQEPAPFVAGEVLLGARAGERRLLGLSGNDSAFKGCRGVHDALPFRWPFTDRASSTYTYRPSLLGFVMTRQGWLSRRPGHSRMFRELLGGAEKRAPASVHLESTQRRFPQHRPMPGD